MRKLLKESQISFWSLPDIKFELNRLMDVADLQMRLTVHGQATKQQHLLNGLILLLASRPPEEQRKLIAEAFQRLENTLQKDDPSESGHEPTKEESIETAYTREGRETEAARRATHATSRSKRRRRGNQAG